MGTIEFQIWINRIVAVLGCITPYAGIRDLPEIHYSFVIGGPILCIICINKLIDLERIKTLQKDGKVKK